MRIVVTGAGGNLGRVAIPALAAAGHDVCAVDARPLELEQETVVADVRDREQVLRMVAGADVVVHAAALHGVHLGDWAPHDFWATNATGTFVVYDAARESGVRSVVLASTMAVYGVESGRDGWPVVTEETPARPRDVYGLSKVVCEEIARHHARNEGVATVALRLGMFVPETFERYGFRLLFGGVDDRDVAHAVLLALEHEPEDGFDVFNVMADVPFDERDGRELATDPAAVVERHWPGAGGLGLSVRELVWGWAVWRVEKAKRVLGYRPRYGFGEFLDAWRRGDRSHYPFAGLSQWGTRS